MQIGLRHLIGGFLTIILLIGGAFAAGSKWTGEGEGSAETAAAVSALDSEATSTEEIFEDAPDDLPLYSVVRVVDGDTIVVSVDGKNESIRMIGIDTPELNDSRTGVQCFAQEAADKTKALVSGKKVRLEKDPSQGDRDKYKRLLAHVFREDGVFVSKTLIAEGFAHEYTYDGAYKYQKDLKAAQSAAKEGEKGLWAPDACSSFEASAKKDPQPTAKAKSSSAKTQPAAAAAAAPTPPPATAPTSQVATQPVQMPQPEVQQPAPPQKQSDPPSAPKPEPAPASNSSVVCSANTYNCTDFGTQKEAQGVYDQCGGLTNDIHKLDKNKDGNACDSLP